VTGLPIKYGDHLPVAPFTPCEACAAETPDPVADHCHEHGWVRATLCRSCNARMALADRRITPLGELTISLIAIATRCPACPRIGIEDLGPTISLRSIHRDKPLVKHAGTTIRVPDGLHDRLARAAAADRRSLASEILWLAEQALQQQSGGKGPQASALRQEAE
jgi:hypothetical protein